MDELSGSVQMFASSQPVFLDLAGVTFVDRAAHAGLRRLEHDGAVLLGCSGFLQELLRNDHTVAAQADAPTAESNLLARLRSGDEPAFEQLVREYGGRMLATARRLMKSEDDARDAVQDALLSAFSGLKSFSGGSQLSTWLHRIVVNAALMKLRRRRRKPEQSIDELLPRFDDQGYHVDDPRQWGAPSADLLEQRETRAQVRACIERLPETYRTVLMMRDIEELDTEEVAALLGVTPNAVKVRLHRARQALRTLLEREFQAAESMPLNAAHTA